VTSHGSIPRGAIDTVSRTVGRPVETPR